jgi:hypothetical protein
MFPSVDRSPRQRNRAVTLIEAVLYIAIALALIVGGLVFFQQTSTAAKTNTMVRQLSAAIAEVKVAAKGLPIIKNQVGESTPVEFDVNSYLIAAGAVPPDMVTSGTSLSNPFGGTTSFEVYYLSPFIGGIPSAHLIKVDLTNIPKGVCARLLTATSGIGLKMVNGKLMGSSATTLVSSGYVWGGAGPSSMPISAVNFFAMNPTQAGWMCKYGANNYYNQTTEPTSAPLSGNVTVTMWFWVDG